MMRRETGRQILRFLFTGSLGFVIDASFLAALVALKSDPYLSRVVSFLLAFLVTYTLNRRWTFKVKAAPKLDKTTLLKYLAAQLTGLLVSFAAYSAVIYCAGIDRYSIAVGFTIGSILAMAFNFLASKFYVFAPPRSSPLRR
jgi:putative flippase GtrA